MNTEIILRILPMIASTAALLVALLKNTSLATIVKALPATLSTLLTELQRLNASADPPEETTQALLTNLELRIKLLEQNLREVNKDE